MLVNLGYVLRKAHRAKEARSIERHAAAIDGPRSTDAIVDVSELLDKRRSRKRYAGVFTGATGDPRGLEKK